GSREEFTAKILAPSVDAIKSVDRRLLVCGPELSHHWVETPEWNLAPLIEAAPNLDVITQHIYPDVSPNPDGFAIYLAQKIKALIGNRRVGITEAGYDVCAKKANEGTQATYIHYLLKVQAERSEWFTKLFFYRLWDTSHKCKSGNGFGLTFDMPIQERPGFL